MNMLFRYFALLVNSSVLFKVILSVQLNTNFSVEHIVRYTCCFTNKNREINMPKDSSGYC